MLRQSSPAQRLRSIIAGAAALLLLAPTMLFAADAPTPAPAADSKRIMQHAKGTFEVKFTPQAEDKAAGATLGRRTLDKRFSGDLAADSKGEMLTVLTDVKGSAAYVAVERITGTLQGRTGSFALVHHGVSSRGAQQATITVAPDSGAGELTGLEGRMEIIMAPGKHAYEFEYTLPQN